MKRRTKEPQYQRCLDLDREGRASFGLMSNQVWRDDPRRIGFVLARYKFVAKMMGGFSRVLEVGCADAFGTRIVRQEVKAVTAVDFDPVFIEDARRGMDRRWPIDYLVHDILRGPVRPAFDGAFALDVIEHIPRAREGRFLRHIAASLRPRGVAIIGTPSLESQAHASPASKAGHVNCKTGPQLKELLSRHFANVFVFSMNDEVVHTGFQPMAHYLLALCCAKK